MTEMVDNAGRIAACVDIPVIADADTGYGNPLNVIRTVGAYEAAGVAGIHIEDQVSPKKCGHMNGKLVIPAGEMAAKIRAAVEARTLFIEALLTDDENSPGGTRPGLPQVREVEQRYAANDPGTGHEPSR